MSETPKIGIVIGTIREGRFGEVAARWIFERAAGRTDLALEVVDLRDYPLPLYGARDSSPADTAVVARWQQKLAALDGYIFVTAEYNHSVSGVLKNALDHAYAEYCRKPAAFVGYGGVGGARAIEQLRLICVEFQMAPTRHAVHIGMEPYRAVTSEGKRLADFDHLNRSAETLLDDLAWWASTLKVGRVERGAA
ncbi:NAD(P)H-dependent FMN reductase [Nannocystis exedens]|uniref:NAD(P)H-dependent FMN reductase n=1 Tax=Nannocystis exedens TaxID=54 RepID=A0A1I2GLZ4_9BACT|nr:NAD(P)H-dependent oxidoreductase [Nannocystis exedens]PCC73612.1 FMN reductase [Nannocystis exedens]SFF17867.1 NAD(P)H-dependent FMN reductase [Nannocystis exedens]